MFTRVVKNKGKETTVNKQGDKGTRVRVKIPDLKNLMRVTIWGIENFFIRLDHYPLNFSRT